MGALEHVRGVRSATATCASTTLREFASTAQAQWLEKSKKAVEPLSSKNSSHGTILDGGFSQEREEPGGSFVDRTTTSLPPGRPSRLGP